MNNSDLVIYKRPKGSTAEAIRTLRTNLQFVGHVTGNKANTGEYSQLGYTTDSNFNVEKNRIQSKEYTSTLCARDWKSPKCVDEIYIKNNTKKGYLIAKDGDGVYTNVSTKRGTVQKEMIQTLTGFLDKGVVTAVAQRKRNNGQQIEISNREYANSLTTVNKDSMIKQELRIRRLTPREYWRLMGFDDEDFDKAKSVNSDSQLYKQAGNSIVVNVLEGIIKNLLNGEC